MKTKLTLLAATAGLFVAHCSIAQEAVAPATDATEAPAQEVVAPASVASSPAQEVVAPVAVANVIAAQNIPLTNVRKPSCSGSIYINTHSFKGDDLSKNYSNSGSAIIGKVQYRRPDSSLSFSLKTWYADVDYDDMTNYDWYNYRKKTWYEHLAGVTESIKGFSAEARYDLQQQDDLLFYVSAGVFYQQSEREYEYIVDYYYRHYEYARDSESQDGTTWIAHVGLESFSNQYYLNAEIGYLGKTYDDCFGDQFGAQFELTGIAGFYLTDRVRLDANVRYLTKYKETYIGAGATYQF